MSKHPYCLLLIALAATLGLHGCTGAGNSAAAAACTWHDDESIMAILYQQRAAEYRALCYQAYNIAALRLKEAAAGRKDSLAVITDLDETALNNSAFEVYEYNNDTTYNSPDWEAWCKLDSATAVPGSVPFFRYAADTVKAAVFYISNRDTSDIAATMENMNRLGFPQIERSHFLFKRGAAASGSKQSRRDSVEKYYHYKVAVLLGDNLIDLDSAYDSQPMSIRADSADAMRQKWGDSYIVFPNANYGDWENTLYNFKYTYSVAQKDSIRKSYLYGVKKLTR